MDPGFCCAFVTPQTRRHTGQSIPGHQADYGYVMSINASTTNIIQHLDSNLNRPRLSVHRLAHLCVAFGGPDSFGSRPNSFWAWPILGLAQFRVSTPKSRVPAQVRPVTVRLVSDGCPDSARHVSCLFVCIVSSLVLVSLFLTASGHALAVSSCSSPESWRPPSDPATERYRRPGSLFGTNPWVLLLCSYWFCASVKGTCFSLVCCHSV